MFRVGGRCPPHSHAISNACYSGIPGLTTRLTGTGLSPSLALRSRRLLVRRFRCTRALTPHPRRLSRRVRFALHRFRSPLLTASRLISFPPLTKMLQFSGFPFAGANDRRTCQDVPLGDPRILDSLRLPEAFRGLARPSSAPEPSHPSDGLAAVNVSFPALFVARVCNSVTELRSGQHAPVVLRSQPMELRTLVLTPSL